ncbi:TlpA disulfide reductase family protein [Robertkochia aurantiaca]|uniref:TlpA disulfide reductase family protein n=1 Tax=Robertkochia aurantiaca TaxID=2873700 RepID=UPI001CCCDD18|nr:TlpA disulfide reductase family protein [Robertkochia sp. 3YJGBD-33]
MKKILLITCFISVMFGCKTKTDSESDVMASLQATPKEVLNSGDKEIPVYDFDGLAPLLQSPGEKTRIVNFWATWCKPCVAELPHFEEIGKKYKDAGVEVILVSLDFPSKTEESLLPFVKEHNLSSQVVLLDDPRQNEWIPKVDENWSGAIPATVIISQNERSFYEKSFTFKELEAELLKHTDN